MELPLDAEAVARLLTEIGQRSELAGELPFKARAYYNAAESLRALAQPLAEIIANRKLRDIPGVGEAIAEKIIKLHKTGTHPTLEYLREQMPAGVLEMLQLPGLGPKKAALIFNTLKVSDLAGLEEACRAGRLNACKGLGGALEKKVLEGIAFRRKGEGKRLLIQANALLQTACESLRESHPKLRRVVPAGPFRRGCEVVDELSIVAENGELPEPLGSGITVHVTDAEHYGIRLLYETGSAAHLEKLAAFAESQGFKLTENGLWSEGRKTPKREILCREELDVYAALGLPYIEPELREGGDEIELARAGKLPALVRDADLRGILHSHTTFSDGADSLEAMAEAVWQRGYQYYGVADHSQSAAYAGGMKEDKIREQHHQADALNVRFGKSFRIFKGVESDIREDGALDYPEELLRGFDFIVASVHSRFTLDKAAQTARLIKAVSNPHTTILGHMTGRLLLRREGYAVNVEDVLKACARHGVVVEINAHPSRLDLDWRWHRKALELGCMMSINPDAHSIEEIDLVRWGVAVARKGGVPKERVLNGMDLEEIGAYFESRRKR